MPQTVVAAASELAARAGSDVADMGGNAVDAVLAATIASMSTELGIVSPGGGAYITIWPPDSEPVVIDAYAEMPGRERGTSSPISMERVSMEYGGGMETVVGWGSVATPGAFAGFSRASREYGRLPWGELFSPTVDVLLSGFSLSDASGYYLGYASDVIYGWDPETALMYHREDGSSVVAGDVLTNRPLADTYSELAAKGAEFLYRGELGEALVAASAERGGLITRRDLADYAEVVRSPSRMNLCGWDIATNAPPAVGGISIIGILTLVERLGIRGWSARDVAGYASVQDAVFSFRRSSLEGDTDRLKSSELLIDLAGSGDLSTICGSPSTVHASAVDENGLACSITASAGYGSGAEIPGTGFGLNNSLGEIELVSEGVHALTPGTRLLSNMAPTVARTPTGEVIALGSPGADRITSAVSSVLMNHIVCGMGLDDAVGHPRIHAEIFDGRPTLATEPNVDTSEVVNLEVRHLPAGTMYFGGVQAAHLDGGGTLRGVADPRRTGGVCIGGRECSEREGA